MLERARRPVPWCAGGRSTHSQGERLTKGSKPIAHSRASCCLTANELTAQERVKLREGETDEEREAEERERVFGARVCEREMENEWREEEVGVEGGSEWAGERGRERERNHSITKPIATWMATLSLSVSISISLHPLQLKGRERIIRFEPHMLSKSTDSWIPGT